MASSPLHHRLLNPRHPATSGEQRAQNVTASLPTLPHQAVSIHGSGLIWAVATELILTTLDGQAWPGWEPPGAPDAG